MILIKRILFAILCMQQAFENAYNYLIGLDDIKEEVLRSLANGDKLKSNAELLQNLDIHDDNELEKFVRFMNSLFMVVDKDNNQKLSDEEMDSFMEVLNFSSITSSSNAEVRVTKVSKFEFNGQVYKSKGGKGKTLGYLGHDMIKEYAQNASLSADDFITTLRSRWKGNTWLRKIIIYKIDILELAQEDIGAYFKADEDIINYLDTMIVVAKWWGSEDILKLRLILDELEPGFKDKVKVIE